MDEWELDEDAFIGAFRSCPGCERLEEEQENAAKAKVRGAKVYLVPKVVYQSAPQLFQPR